jgi:hypothetical protein
MSNTMKPTWPTLLMERHADLFRQEIDGQYMQTGYPYVGDGWRELLETALLRIETALHGAPSGRVDPIKYA